MPARTLSPTMELANRLQKHLATEVRNPGTDEETKARARMITCHDGARLEVQAGVAWRSSPPLNYGPWETVFMQTEAAPTAEMVRCAEPPSGQKYYGVPIAVAAHFIRTHGGARLDAQAELPNTTKATAANCRDVAARFVSGDIPDGVCVVRIEHVYGTNKLNRMLSITVERTDEAVGPYLVTHYEWQKALTAAAPTRKEVSMP